MSLTLSFTRGLAQVVSRLRLEEKQVRSVKRQMQVTPSPQPRYKPDAHLSPLPSSPVLTGHALSLLPY
jgi:hypothetical protein